MRRTAIVVIVSCLCAAASWAQPLMQADVTVDRTAFFVGEPIRYQVRVRHDPAIEFILDRLDRTALEMPPFEVQNVTVEQSRQGERHVLKVTLVLVTYDIAQKEWQIPPLTLYYASHANAGPGQRPVERLTIPAVPVGFRSSLPQGSNTIRTEITFPDFQGAFWALLSVGLLSLLVLGGRGAHLVYQRLRTPESSVEDRHEIEKRAAQAVRELLESPQPEEDAASASAFYRSMSDILRDYTGRVSGRSGPSLTAREVRETLRLADNPERAQRVADLVALGDHVRYTDEGPRVGRDRLDEVRLELRQIFSD